METSQEYITSSDFYPILKETVMERIKELQDELKIFANIDRARGLFPYEKGKRNACARALTTNESFMLYFDKDFLRMQ